ncbi:MAG TPA: hypothetical protein PLM72_07395 [Spirochaetota bacterium]|nr:hypothetical protein [Spirochaetota bacterium]
MAIAREIWAKELYLAASLYQGEFLPTLKKYNPEMQKNKSYHITVIPAQSATYRAYGAASAQVTYTKGAPTDVEVIVKDEVYSSFYLDDEQLNTTETPLIQGFATEANEAVMKAIETNVALTMAINCLAGNKIELASGNQITVANLNTMRQNMLNAGSDFSDCYFLINPTYETNIRNIKDPDTNEKLFLSADKYQPGVLANGVIGTILGFKVILCHTLPTLNDAGTAYDAAGETAMVYYDSRAYAYGADPNAMLDTERDIDNIPVRNKVLVRKYVGHKTVDSNFSGHVREYSA